MQGTEIRVQGLEFRGLGFRVWSLGVEGSGLRVFFFVCVCYWCVGCLLVFVVCNMVLKLPRHLGWELTSGTFQLCSTETLSFESPQHVFGRTA